MTWNIKWLLKWRKQFYVATCVYLGQIVLCFCMAWPKAGQFRNVDTSPLKEVITHKEHMVIDLVYIVGILIGTVICGFLSNCKGRKSCFLVSAMLSFSAFLILSGANVLNVIYIGKFLNGLASGISLVTILVYLGEIASTKVRGLVLISANAFVFVQGWLDMFTEKVPYSIMCYYGAFISAVFLMTLFYIPESPVYLTLKGTNDHLERSLLSLGRENELDTMLQAKLETSAVKKTHLDHWMEIFKLMSNRKAVFITVPLNVLQSLGGSMVVLYFASILLFFEPKPIVPVTKVIMIVNACITLGGSISLFLVERIGRKTLLMISTGSCGISLCLLATYFVIEILTVSDSSGVLEWLYIIVLANYFVSFSLGFRTIPLTLVGEMFTPNVRSTGCAFVVFISTIFGYLITTATNSVLATSSISPISIFIVYSFTNVIAFVFTLFLLPETKGLTFSEVNELMSKKRLLFCA